VRLGLIGSNLGLRQPIPAPETISGGQTIVDTVESKDSNGCSLALLTAA
jgi:hypothetical protein